MRGKFSRLKIKNHWSKDTLPLNQTEASKTMFWHGSDSEENYAKNPNKNYSSTDITYKFNSHGFRTQEFDVNSMMPSILCLGCSFTMGIALPIEQVWSSLLADEFQDYNVYNLGVAGSSGDTIARILFQVANKLNTKIVCILWPEIHRYEIYRHDVFHTSAIGGFKIDPKLLIDDTHFTNLRYKNQAIVSLLQEKYKYDVIEFSTRCVERVENDFSRDAHPGPQTQKNIFHMFKEQIYKKLNYV